MELTFENVIKIRVMQRLYNGIWQVGGTKTFLSNTQSRSLDEFNLDTRINLFFRQDKAPAHNVITIRKNLNQIIGHKRTGSYYGRVQ